VSAWRATIEDDQGVVIVDSLNGSALFELARVTRTWMMNRPIGRPAN
jgi:hypothetical protein